VTTPLERHYRPKVGWPYDESPRLSYPDRVEYEGELWEVLEVDVLGRWLCRIEDYEETRERYLDPADLLVDDVYDHRRVYGPRAPRDPNGSPMEQIGYLMEDIYLPSIKKQLEQPNYLLGLLKGD
jgi:hypothetical protein